MQRLKISLCFLLACCIGSTGFSKNIIQNDTTKNNTDSLVFSGKEINVQATLNKIDFTQFTPGNRYNPYQLIQGKIPGVVISRPGGDPNAAFQIQIRGLHAGIYRGFSYFPTANGYNQQFNNTEPLIVVDGFPGVALNTLDPQDIESITVIKDAASLAAYGMRGANGVILISSKKGTRDKGLQYHTYFAMDRASNPDLGIDAATYRSLIGNNGTFQGVNQNLGANNNWYELISRTGFSQAHNLAFNGAALGADYRFAVNFREVNGIAQKSSFDQINASFNFQRPLQKGKGKLEGLFAVNSRNNNQVNPDIFRNAALMNPTAPIFDSNSPAGTYYQPQVFALFNPLGILNLQNFEDTHQTITSGLNLELTLLKGIKGKVQGAFQHNEDGYGAVIANQGIIGTSAAVSWEERKLSHWFMDAQLQGDWTWGTHRVQTQLGYTHQRWDGRGTLRQDSTLGQTLPTYRYLIDFADRTDEIFEDPYRESDELPAVYWNGQYSLNERWFASASLRREGFTRLGAEKWMMYPAFKLGGYLIAPNAKQQYLKLQLGYGLTGNIPPKTYATELIVLPGGVPVYSNGVFKPGIYYPFVPNPDLRAELRKELNVGLDFALLNNRLQGQIQVYQSRSTELLWQYATNEPQGFSNVYFENLMALKNQGLEVQLNFSAVQTNNLSWQSNLSLAHNRTTLDSPFPQASVQGNPNQQLVGSPGSPGFCCAGLQLLETGKPIGQFYTYRSDGIDAQGQWKTIDINGDGQINESTDRQITGIAQPDLTLGWDNTLIWKQFTLNVFWRGAIGHELLNAFNLFYANPKHLQDFRSYSIPEVALSSRFAKLRSNTTPISDYFVENATFMRLENLSIAYDFSTKSQKKFNLKLYLSTQNLLTISLFTGNDPEIRLSNVGTPLSPGIVNPNYWGVSRDLSGLDRGRYPITQTLVFGAVLKL